MSVRGKTSFYREWQAQPPHEHLASRIYVLRDDGRMTAAGQYRFPSQCFELQVIFRDGDDRPRFRYQRPVAEKRRRTTAFNGWVFGVRFLHDVSALLDEVSAECWVALLDRLEAVTQGRYQDAHLSNCLDELLSGMVGQGMNQVPSADTYTSDRVSELATRANVSERTLRRRVRCDTGLSPKALMSLTRFDSLLTQSITADQGLAAAAADAGFSDQSHMHREFTKRTGMTPGQFRKRWCPRIPGEKGDTLVSLTLD